MYIYREEGVGREKGNDACGHGAGKPLAEGTASARVLRLELVWYIQECVHVGWEKEKRDNNVDSGIIEK